MSQTAAISSLDYDIFAGIDVDKKSLAVTFIDHSKFVRSLKMSYDAQNLMNYVKNHFQGKRIAFAYEAGPTGYGLYDELIAAGQTCLVVSPALIPKKPGAMVKTNRIDSYDTALAIRAGQVESIRIPAEPYRSLRHLTHLRGDYVDQIKATKIRIKALLLFEGIAFPDAGSAWSKKILDALASLSCSESIRFELDSLLETLDFNRKKAAKVLKEIRRLCKSDKDVSDSLRYLTSIVGIGTITAVHVLARLGDWRQLRNSDEIGAYFGLVPRENSTGDTVHKGRITRAGDSRVRSMLVEAAWVAIRLDSELAQYFERIKSKNNIRYASRIAIVAVARKLTKRIYSVLTERREYVVR